MVLYKNNCRQSESWGGFLFYNWQRAYFVVKFN